MPADAQFRDFDAETADTEPACTFRLGGRIWSVRARETVPFSMVQRIMDASKNATETAFEVGPFFKSVIVAEQVDDFVAMLNAPDSSVTLEKVTPILTFVFENLSGRPTVPAAQSSTGRKRAGRKSAAGSSSPATHRKASTG